MGINAYVDSYLGFGYHTQNSGTEIDEEIPGRNNKRLALVGVDYLSGSTAQTLNIMHSGSSSGSRNTTSAAALSGQADIVCTNNPLAPGGSAAAAGSDIIAYQITDGTWEFNTVSSVASKTITLSNNITGVDSGGGLVGLASGAAVRIFGIVGDNSSFVIGLAATTQYSYRDTIICQAPFIGDPLYVRNDNASNASFQNNLLFAYINK